MALCRLMGKPELIADERFATMQALRAHHDEVDQIIDEGQGTKATFLTLLGRRPLGR